MKTKDLNAVPDVKGAKKSVGSDQQIANSVKMENACNNGSTKKYLKPSKDAKISDFFNYERQEREHQNNVNLLAISITAKYGSLYSVEFANGLFNDAKEFTSNFTKDIVSSVESGINFEEISYIRNANTIDRYLVAVDSPKVCSIFEHFVNYAISSNRESVSLIIEDQKKESERKRLANINAKREEKAIKTTTTTVQNLDINKLLSMLTPEQIAAIKSAKVA